MKIALIGLIGWLAVFLPGITAGQSLIANGSFETYQNCPYQDNLLKEAVPWFNPTRATPDFYHQCFQTGQMELPPHTGKGLAHLFLDRGWSEYLAAPLLKPMEANQCYYFEMYVAQETPNKFLGQTLGAYFSTDPVTSTTTELLNVNPQILDTQLTSSDPALKWERVSGFVTAKGGEKYVTIGSYYKYPPLLGFYYLFIDDISLLPVKLDLGRDTTLCGHKSTYLLNAEVPGALDYRWNDGSTAPTLKVARPGTYSVKVTTPCKTLTDTITIDYSLDFDLGPDTTLCNGQTLKLTVPDHSNTTYWWQDGFSQNVYTVKQAGQYSVLVTQASCQITDSIQIHYTDPPRLELGPNQDLCGAESFTIKPIVGDGRFAWQDQFPTQERTINHAGIFRASVQNECATLTDSIIISYGACDCALYAPSLFTPNGDGQNDVFTAFGCGDITLTSLSIFDRWGELIFRTDTPPFQWDGTYRGKQCTPGVYAWRIQYQLNQRNKITLDQKEGALSLIR